MSLAIKDDFNDYILEGDSSKFYSYQSQSPGTEMLVSNDYTTLLHDTLVQWIS